MSQITITTIVVAIIAIIVISKFVIGLSAKSNQSQIEGLKDEVKYLKKKNEQEMDMKAMLTAIVGVLDDNTDCLVQSADAVLNIYLGLSDETKLETSGAIKKSLGLPMSAKAINELLCSVLNAYKSMNNDKQQKLALMILTKFIEKC